MAAAHEKLPAAGLHLQSWECKLSLPSGGFCKYLWRLNVTFAIHSDVHTGSWWSSLLPLFIEIVWTGEPQVLMMAQSKQWMHLKAGTDACVPAGNEYISFKWFVQHCVSSWESTGVGWCCSVKTHSDNLCITSATSDLIQNPERSIREAVCLQLRFKR